jgi:hypothetical protein
MAARDSFGPIDGDDEERGGFGLARELRQELERGVVGPVKIVEHESERPRVRDCHQQFADAGEERCAVGDRGASCREQVGEPSQRFRCAGGACAAARGAGERGDRTERRGAEGARGGVHRPEPGARERSLHERGLADPRFARDEDDSAAALGRLAGEDFERRALLRATDEP